MLQITERALIQRINRKLNLKNRTVIKTRGETADLGDYHVWDSKLKRAVKKHLTLADLEVWAKKLKVLTDWDNTWVGKAARLHKESGKGDGTFGKQR
jgi:hypothetical protein